MLGKIGITVKIAILVKTENTGIDEKSDFFSQSRKLGHKSQCWSKLTGVTNKMTINLILYFDKKYFSQIKFHIF